MDGPYNTARPFLLYYGMNMIILTNGNGWAGPVAWERNKCYSHTKFTKSSVKKHERDLPL